MNPSPRFYPKIGGDITYGCQRLAQGLNTLGAIAILYRGKSESAETGISLAPGFKFGSEEFKGLTEKILDNCYAQSIRIPDKACQMLAEATDAEDVILFEYQLARHHRQLHYRRVGCLFGHIAQRRSEGTSRRGENESDDHTSWLREYSGGTIGYNDGRCRISTSRR
jgi:hypothetical protein